MRTTGLVLLLTAASATTLPTRLDAAPVEQLATAQKPPRLLQRLLTKAASLLPGHAEPFVTLGKIEPEQKVVPTTRRSEYTRKVEWIASARWTRGDGDRKTARIIERWNERPTQSKERIGLPRGFAPTSPQEALANRIAGVRARLETATPSLRRAILPLIERALEEMIGTEIGKHDASAKFDGKTLRLYTSFDSTSKVVKLSFRDLGSYGGSEFADIELN